jgi:hypothetical protein
VALINKAWREGEFVPPGAEPGLTRGFSWRDAVEAQAVMQIAKQRFAYPTPSEPNLRAYTNLPDRSLGVRDLAGQLVFPDIVVIDGPTTEVRMLGEVETVRSLESEADLPEKWRTFQTLGPLYLFVPMSLISEAKARLKEAGIKPAGLRTWRHMAGMDFTDVVDINL